LSTTGTSEGNLHRNLFANARNVAAGARTTSQTAQRFACRMRDSDVDPAALLLLAEAGGDAPGHVSITASIRHAALADGPALDKLT
jgi:hypothetical protein